MLEALLASPDLYLVSAKVTGHSSTAFGVECNGLGWGALGAFLSAPERRDIIDIGACN